MQESGERGLDRKMYRCLSKEAFVGCANGFSQFIRTVTEISVCVWGEIETHHLWHKVISGAGSPSEAAGDTSSLRSSMTVTAAEHLAKWNTFMLFSVSIHLSCTDSHKLTPLHWGLSPDAKEGTNLGRRSGRRQSVCSKEERCSLARWRCLQQLLRRFLL